MLVPLHHSLFPETKTPLELLSGEPICLWVAIFSALLTREQMQTQLQLRPQTTMSGLPTAIRFGVCKPLGATTQGDGTGAQRTLAVLQPPLALQFLVPDRESATPIQMLPSLVVSLMFFRFWRSGFFDNSLTVELLIDLKGI